MGKTTLSQVNIRDVKIIKKLGKGGFGLQVFPSYRSLLLHFTLFSVNLVKIQSHHHSGHFALKSIPKNLLQDREHKKQSLAGGNPHFS